MKLIKNETCKSCFVQNKKELIPKQNINKNICKAVNRHELEKSINKPLETPMHYKFTMSTK